MTSALNPRAQFVDSDGFLTDYGRRWLNGLQTAVGGALPTDKSAEGLTPSASPYSFTATSTGRVAISGGTVSLVRVGRLDSFFDVGQVAGLVPVRKGDVVEITYTVAPTVTFLPD